MEATVGGGGLAVPTGISGTHVPSSASINGGQRFKGPRETIVRMQELEVENARLREASKMKEELARVERMSDAAFSRAKQEGLGPDTRRELSEVTAERKQHSVPEQKN